MELIAAAVAFYAVFMPLFLATELGVRPAGADRQSMRRAAELATREYLAKHPVAVRAEAANDAEERLAA
jgi:hypothetical protein